MGTPDACIDLHQQRIRTPTAAPLRIISAKDSIVEPRNSAEEERAADRLLDLRNQVSSQQRVTAQIEKVVADSDPRNAQHRFPDPHQYLFQSITRLDPIFQMRDRLPLAGEQQDDLLLDNSEYGMSRFHIFLSLKQRSEPGDPQLGLLCNRSQQGQIVIQHSRHSCVVEERSRVLDSQPPTLIGILDELHRQVENGRAGY